MTLALPARRAGRIVEVWTCSSCRRLALQQSKVSFSTVTLPWKQPKPQSRRRHAIPTNQDNRNTFSTFAPSLQSQRRAPKLPPTPARTRFAPSPTGYLHIGGLRTALFSYLLARRTGGQFLLRIEDTDRKRLVPDAETRLVRDLQWAGLEWDEGPGVGGPYGPYRQSERTEVYLEHSNTLLENGTAYRCFCTPQKSGQGEGLEVLSSGCYQGCSDLNHEESRIRAETHGEVCTVRLRVPDDAHKRVYPDLVYGKIQRLKRSPAAPVTEDGEGGMGSADTILLKSDGTPTYHFANVVDDHLMHITHVIRGVEWSASTPLHYDIYSAFGWTPPQFAHVGLLVDQNRAKLSKRNQDLALDVGSMRDAHGVLPQTLNNFLALLGWSNPTQNDMMDMRSLIENFDLKFTKGNAMVRMEKLWFLQRKHVAERCAIALEQRSSGPIEDMVAHIKTRIGERYPELPTTLPFAQDEEKLSAYIASILLSDPSNYQNSSQWLQRSRPFFDFSPLEIPAERELYDSEKAVTGEMLKSCAQQLQSELDAGQQQSQSMTLESVLSGGVKEKEKEMHEVIDKLLNGKPELNKPMVTFLREKIAMGLPGPSIYLVMALLGKEECCRRLNLGLKSDRSQTGRVRSL